MRRRKKFLQYNEERKQPPCSGTYRQHIWVFCVCKKTFQRMGASASRACAGRRPAPPYLEMFSYKHKIPKYAVYKSLNKEVVSVPHYIEETFFDVSNWKLPLRVRLPTSPFSNVDNELIAKSLAQTHFTCFEDENSRIKRLFRRISSSNQLKIGFLVFKIPHSETIEMCVQKIMLPSNRAYMS